MEKQEFFMEIEDILSNRNKCYKNKEFSIELLKQVIRNKSKNGTKTFSVNKYTYMQDYNDGNIQIYFSYEDAIPYFIDQGFTVEETNNSYRISWGA